MNIGFFTELFPPSVGGQEQRFAALADLLASRGHRVTVACIRHPTDCAAEETLPSGVQVVRVAVPGCYYKPRGGMLPRSPSGMMRFAVATRRLAQAGNFDAIFLNQWPLLHIPALCRRDRLRTVVDWCEIRRSLPFRIAQRLLPKVGYANTAVSTDVALTIRRSTPGRVLVLPSGVSVTTYRDRPAPERSGLLYVGRVTRHKNLGLLIETFEELCRRGGTEKLTIAGTGPDLEAIRRRADNSPFHPGIEVLGFVSDERKVELLSSAKVLMMTSQREGFPRVVAEAMASGLPIVTARYPQNGTVAVVQEFGSGLCANADPGALADAVEAVAADWQAWSARSREHAGTLDWSSLVLRLEALLQHTAAAAINPNFVHNLEGLPCELL
ncbi:MAG TPA: glycosyltransferase family 4 protein [Rhodopila sp.]|nr:glycosyltransferase family 4 protein [Rhodopila sp.]